VLIQRDYSIFHFHHLDYKTGMYWILDNVDNVSGVTKSLEAGVIITWTCAPALIKVELMLFYRLQFHQKFQVEFSYRLKLT
jgi:hypothetical protein